MYVVKGVPLIPQTLNMACWYASAQMLIQWRRERMQMSELGLLDPSEDPLSVVKWKANNGIDDAFILTLAADLGLERVPPQTATLQAIHNWLYDYGPLWLNGTSHITVIAGVDIGGEQVFIHDPWPVNMGKKEWRSVDWLYGFGSEAGVASVDPQTTAGVFLHCPG
jgi:Papain-like cysteine protease AvrRpt2